MKVHAKKTVQMLLALAALPLVAAIAARASGIPDSIAAKGETHVVTVHAEGAQVYECKTGASGKLTWTFREPVATLLIDGKTVGRHYAGPQWEWQDGSRIAAKVAARAPGATANDIPLLKLEVTDASGAGMLKDVMTIQRLATRGGVAEGDCLTTGLFLSVPYAADYAFFRKAQNAQGN